MKQPPTVMLLAKEVADSMNKIESPFYSDVSQRIKPYYKGTDVTNRTKRGILFNKVVDLLRDKGKRIWS